VIWTSREFTDRLRFWWFADAIRRSRLTFVNSWVVEETYFGFYGPHGVGARTPAELRQAFLEARRFTRPWVALAASLWRHYAGKSPRDFDQACRKAYARAPNLKIDTRIFSAFFPQINVARGSQLRLSEFDQTLFNQLDTVQWRRPIDLFNHEVYKFVSLGTSIIPWRLKAWDTHLVSNPSITTRNDGPADNAFKAISCRLTAHGKRLRDYGLEKVTEAPGLALGGCVAYAPNPPWVRWNRGNRSYIDLLR
jgi:hypothetical protein